MHKTITTPPCTLRQSWVSVHRDIMACWLPEINAWISLGSKKSKMWELCHLATWFSTKKVHGILLSCILCAASDAFKLLNNLKLGGPKHKFQYTEKQNSGVASSFLLTYFDQILLCTYRYQFVVNVIVVLNQKRIFFYFWSSFKGYLRAPYLCQSFR